MAEVELTPADARVEPPHPVPSLRRGAGLSRARIADQLRQRSETPLYAARRFVLGLCEELAALPALASGTQVACPPGENTYAAVVPLSELERALVQTARRTGDASLGLTVALGSHAALLPGLLDARERPSVRAALVTLCRAGLPLDGAALTLLEHGAVATVRCRLPLGYPAIERFFSEYLFATLLQLFEAQHPQVRIEVQRALFRHAAAPLEDRHARAFRGPVLFNQRVHALRFARRLLDLPRSPSSAPGCEPAPGPLVLSVASGATPVSERVRAWLGTRTSLAEIDACSVARALGLTQRALRRRLASDGTSLSALADEVRCRTAREALSRNVPIDVIVAQTGFRERSGFFRAFKRWTGRTPAQFR